MSLGLRFDLFQDLPLQVASLTYKRQGIFIFLQGSYFFSLLFFQGRYG